MLKAFFVEKSACFSVLQAYSDFQIDELHRHNQNLVGTLHNKNTKVPIVF